jgi:hypothetical protein
MLDDGWKKVENRALTEIEHARMRFLEDRPTLDLHLMTIHGRKREPLPPGMSKKLFGQTALSDLQWLPDEGAGTICTHAPVFWIEGNR